MQSLFFVYGRDYAADFLRRLRCFYPWRHFHDLNIDHTQRQSDGHAIDLLLLGITRSWRCNQGSGKNKSGLDLRCGRFLLWNYPERHQCLRSHPKLGVCFLYSRNSWICREISVCCHCLRTHSQNRNLVSCGTRSIVVNFVLTTMWPDICDVTFSV